MIGHTDTNNHHAAEHTGMNNHHAAGHTGMNHNHETLHKGMNQNEGTTFILPGMWLTSMFIQHMIASRLEDMRWLLIVWVVFTTCGPSA